MKNGPRETEFVRAREKIVAGGSLCFIAPSVNNRSIFSKILLHNWHHTPHFKIVFLIRNKDKGCVIVVTKKISVEYNFSFFSLII